MAEELATNPVGAPTDAPSPEVDTPEQDTDPVETDSTEQPDDTDEVDWEGSKYRIPKALKPALMMQSDYTRKTQELAEQRRGLEERDRSLAEQSRIYQQHLQEVARLVAYDDALKEWAKVNWVELSQKDPAGTQALRFQYEKVRDDRNQLAAQLDYKVRQAQATEQRESAKRAEENRATLSKLIPEWSSDLETKLTNFAISQGLSKEQIGSLSSTNPVAVKILNLAYVGQQLIDKQRKAAEPKPPQANPVPQLTTRSSPATVNPLTDKAKTEDWIKARNAQIAKAKR